MLSPEELKLLSKRLKNGEEDAFSILYLKYFEPLQHFAMRYVYDWSQAEDMVQNAFFKLWINIGKYDENRDFKRYLYIFVKNECLNYLRTMRISDRHKDKLIEALLFSRIEDPEIDPHIRRRLDNTLELMSGKQRDVLMKHVVERKTIAEISREMHVAESTVSTHFKRAMKLLRTNLRFILIGF